MPVLAFQAQTMQDVQKPQPIDVDKVESWAQLRSSQKQTEARKTLADFGTIPSNIPTVQQETPLQEL